MVYTHTRILYIFTYIFTYSRAYFFTDVFNHVQLATAPQVQAPGNPRCLLAALANGEVRVYNEKALVSVHALPSPATALWFGRFSREDNTLIVASRSGALDMKILPRNARLDAPGASGPPPEQDVPLAVPKKTRLYVEQTARERDQAVAMHRTFQRDLVKARLEAARAYVKVLTDGQGAASFTSNAALSLNAAVRGLGPAFRVVLTLRNEAKEPASDVVALLQYDDFMYRAAQRQISVPLLVPGLSYTLEVGVQCLRPAAGSDSIRILLVAKGSPAPLLTALLKMPLSEMDLDG